MTALVLCLPAVAHARDLQRKVLVLYSTGRDAAISLTGERELPRILDHGLDRRLDYHSEYIDAGRFPDPAYQAGFRDFLRVKYTDLRFDLVIGADGLHSAVRRLAFGSQDRFETYLGYMAAVFEIGRYRPRDELVYVSHSAPGKLAARFAMRDDRTMFLLVFAAAAPPSPGADDIQAQKAILHSQFADAGWECPQILAALDRYENLYFDRVSQIRMNSWWRGRVALVGDAAFSPSLMAGQGAALAMIAAYVLASELAAISPRSSCAGAQPSTRFSSDESATTHGMSPSRRPPILTSMLCPAAFCTASIRSSTE